MTDFNDTKGKRRWLTSKQAVEYLGLRSRHALYAKVRRGQIPGYKLGNLYYFNPDELDAAISQGRIGKYPVSAVRYGQ